VPEQPFVERPVLFVQGTPLTVGRESTRRAARMTMTKTRLFAMSTLLAACSATHPGRSTVTLAPSPSSDAVASKPAAPAAVDAASTVLAWSDTFASDVRTQSNGSVCDASVAIEPALRAAGSTPDEPVEIASLVQGRATASQRAARHDLRRRSQARTPRKDRRGRALAVDHVALRRGTQKVDGRDDS
jgi:hypothetical protein